MIRRRRPTNVSYKKKQGQRERESNAEGGFWRLMNIIREQQEMDEKRETAPLKAISCWAGPSSASRLSSHRDWTAGI